jgi:LysM repeat protein
LGSRDTHSDTITASGCHPDASTRDSFYEVKHGDALILIARKFGMTVAQLKTFNGLQTDKIRVNQMLKIPTLAELSAIAPLQPQADPNNPVRAAVVGFSQLNIYQGDALIAVFPISPARPGLHGRGSWTILDAIPGPRLATLQEERTEQIRKPGPTSTIPEPTPSPTKAVLSSEQYLAAGPRNPVGSVWINLAKANSTVTLPYGLHGTSIPDQMNVEQSIGGFRLANWDIARVVHRLPVGTSLEWK